MALLSQPVEYQDGDNETVNGNTLRQSDQYQYPTYQSGFFRQHANRRGSHLGYGVTGGQGGDTGGGGACQQTPAYNLGVKRYQCAGFGAQGRGYEGEYERNTQG